MLTVVFYVLALTRVNTEGFPSACARVYLG